MEKNIRNFLAVLLFSSSSYANVANEVNHQQAINLMSVGTITVSSAHTLDDINRIVKIKADKLGVSAYRIIGVSGNNLLHGTAIIYR